MGLMRFIAPGERITEDAVDQAYLSGLDRVPLPVRIRRENDLLVVERPVSESAAFCIPWFVDGYGQVTLATGTLMERDQPYYLPLELARGKLGQVRNQLFDWETVGLSVSDSVRQKVGEATRLLSQAAVDRDDPGACLEQSDRAIRVALDAANQLAGSYAEQALAVRRRVLHRVPSFLGANLGISPLEDYPARQFLQAFNAAVVPLVWKEIETSEGNFDWEVCDRQIEWCRASGLTVCGGPLIHFDDRHLPDWLAARRNFNAILDAGSRFVQAVIGRYRTAVDIWIAAGRINTGDVLSMNEEEKVKLTARALELIRSLDADKRAVVSFDQPWGEYLTRRTNDFPPLHFADALIRAGLGISGLALEVNVGYSPGGTLSRDPLDFSRMVDYWGMLGVPLFLCLTVPSGSQHDPLAQRLAKLPAESWTPKHQQTWVNRFVPLLLAKPSVQGILWSQFRDSEPHDFPHGGLFDLRRHPKPALRQLESIRQAYLR